MPEELPENIEEAIQAIYEVHMIDNGDGTSKMTFTFNRENPQTYEVVFEFDTNQMFGDIFRVMSWPSPEDVEHMKDMTTVIPPDLKGIEE